MHFFARQLVRLSAREVPPQRPHLKEKMAHKKQIRISWCAVFDSAGHKQVRQHGFTHFTIYLWRFRCTSNSEIAAAVTPLIRAAWPMVAGWPCLSLVRTSTDRPRTIS